MYLLSLLGGVSIDGVDGPVIGRAVQRHRLALLGILAASRAPGVSREKLVTYLWPERSAPRGRHALADSIYARVDWGWARDGGVASRPPESG